MSPRRTLSRLAAVVIAGVLAVGLVGCGDVNAGSAASAKLDALVGPWDETVTIDGGSSNTLPWSGTASATVVVDAETPDERVEEMIEDLGAFLEESDGGTASWQYLDLQVGAFRVGISDDSATRSQRVDALEELRSDDRVVGAFVRAAGERLVSDTGDEFGDPPVVFDDVRGSIRAIVISNVGFETAYSIARDAAALADGLADRAVVATSEDEMFAVTDSGGADGSTTRSTSPTATLALAASITETAPVRSVIAGSDTLAVRLETAAQVDVVRGTFQPSARATGIDLVVEGGIVTDLGGASAESLAVARSLDGMEGVISIGVEGASLAVAVDGVDVVAPAVETLLAQAGIDSVTSVSLTGGRFDVTVPPSDLGRMAAIIAAVEGSSDLVRLYAADGTTQVEVDQSISLASLAALFSPLKPHLIEGEPFALRGITDNAVSLEADFVVADTIDIAVPEGTRAEDVEFGVRVAAAWAAAG